MSKSWEDLRLVLAIAQGKGLSGASRHLGVHHATVLRRLNSLEYRNGVVLFDRLATGYIPTEAGEELAYLAQAISEDVDTAYRKMAGDDFRLSGTLRLATSDVVAQTLLPPVLQEFAQRYRDVEIQCIISSHNASLQRREADLAMRLVKKVPDTLVGNSLGRIGYGVYVHKSLVVEPLAQLDIKKLEWVGDDDSIAHVSPSIWRQNHYPDVVIRYRADTMLSKFMGVKLGLGAGIIPHYLAKTAENLVCLESKPGEWELELWCFSHPDLYRLRRLSAFIECAEEVLSRFDLSAIDSDTVVSIPNY